MFKEVWFVGNNSGLVSNNFKIIINKICEIWGVLKIFEFSLLFIKWR